MYICECGMHFLSLPPSLSCTYVTVRPKSYIERGRERVKKWEWRGREGERQWRRVSMYICERGMHSLSFSLSLPLYHAHTHTLKGRHTPSPCIPGWTCYNTVTELCIQLHKLAVFHTLAVSYDTHSHQSQLLHSSKNQLSLIFRTRHKKLNSMGGQ